MATNGKNNYVRKERIQVKSAIPSLTMNLNSLPSRPAHPASLGGKVNLYTNHFNCSFGNNLPLYQYDILIEGLGARSGDWYEVKGRARCALIMQSLIPAGRLDQNTIIWHDEQRCLYSTSLLQTPRLITSADGQQRLQIKALANQWSTNDINDYTQQRAKAFPFDAVRILETLLKKSLQDRIYVVHNTCYFTNERPKKLAGGFEERLGFTQALNLSSNSLALNVHTKLTTFYPEMPLMEFIQLQLNHNRVPNKHECKKLASILKGCSVSTQQSNWTQTYEIDRFDERKPGEISVETGSSLIEYYAVAKGIKLACTNYPCVQVYLPGEYTDPCHLPLEVCRIKGWQVYDKPISKAQEAQQPRKHIPKPNERYDAIMGVLHRCAYNDPSNQLCRAVEFRIDDGEMKQVTARVLNQPQIQTGPNQQANVRIGRIPLDGHLFTPKPLTALAITYFGLNPEGAARPVKEFTTTLLIMLKNYHVNTKHQSHTVHSSMEEIDRYFEDMQKRGCQFVVCIMDARHDDELQQLKLNIKDCATIKHGVMTQCTSLAKIATNRSLAGYCENLLRKINFKNAGINTKVNLDVALKNKKSTKDSLMFFGADVIHPTNVTRQHPSIAAVVGSGDSLCSTTAVRVCQQYPKQGKCSIETILGLTDMVEQLLEYNQKANKVLPNKIVFYRDGVDDGQFGKVLAHEVPSIREAFNRKYGDKANHPLLTLIVVKKRHNTRFFDYIKAKDETRNLAIGAVIDTTIVHPYQNNFYLNSHTAFQGVNHPSLYHVLLDEIGFTADELQLLTFHLCFTDPRSSAAEAIPSVVHQADIAALKARDLFYDDESSSTTSAGGRSQPLQNPTLDDVEYKILDVHENLRDRPVFG